MEPIINYLTEKYSKGDQYNTLNIHRSAISAFHDVCDTVKVGKHPAVVSIMSAFFNARPPLPRYAYTWEVQTVLDYILALGENKNLALKQLTMKTAMLLAMACAGRSSDLCAFDIRYMRMESEKVTFTLAKLTKSRRKGKPPLKIEMTALRENLNLCVRSTLQVYLERTSQFRERSDGSRNQLFLSFVEPHRPVVPCTIAGWLVKLMTQAGINTEEFKAHSTRGASTSKAAAMGLSVKEIMNMAKWKHEATFYNHYCKEIIDASKSKTKKFENVVLLG